MSDESDLHSEAFAVRWLEAESTLRAFVAAVVWDSHHAEDVLQEVASTVAQNYRSFDASRPFLPWCLGIARMKIKEYLRATSRDRVVLSDATLLALESAATDLVDDQLMARRVALQGCVRRLQGRQRQVIEMRYLLETSLDEIARQLATSTSSIAVTLHRARANLRECVMRTVATEGISK